MKRRRSAGYELQLDEIVEGVRYGRPQEMVPLGGVYSKLSSHGPFKAGEHQTTRMPSAHPRCLAAHGATLADDYDFLGHWLPSIKGCRSFAGGQEKLHDSEAKGMRYSCGAPCSS